ncbi:hypothetical protein TIFTF001_025247 [Ficus carica]|uniref:Uncharacterized protein n=1 Tax=Ficus carica TaxID=3494 RepID=A0AA88DH70_FICCA|nr:hypothetical protein TIFTF001_025247 [Ficus carica]
MKQSPGQSVNEFYSQMSFLWDQLALPEARSTCEKDAALFDEYRDNFKIESVSHGYE